MRLEQRLAALEKRVLEARSINDQREEYFTTEDGRLWKRYIRNGASVIELPCKGAGDDPMRAILLLILNEESMPDELGPEEMEFFELAWKVRDRF